MTTKHCAITVRNRGYRRILAVAIVASLWTALGLAQGQTQTYPGTEPTVQQAVSGTATAAPSSPPGTAAGAAPAAKAGSAATTAAEAQKATVETRVRAIRPEGGTARSTGKGAFEPIMNNPVKYGDVPDIGELVELSSGAAATPITDVLEALAKATNWNIVCSKEAESQSIRLWVKDVKPKQLLEVLRFNGLYYDFDPKSNFLQVTTVKEYQMNEHGGLKSADFRISHADVKDIESILSTLMSPLGRSVVDPRTGNILVWDTQDNLDEMKKALARLDVPLKPRVFTLKHTNSDNLIDSVESMLSERGLAQADPRVNTIVVTDLPARQDQIAQMIAMLDKKLETRIWTLNNADPEAIAERLTDLVPEEMGKVSEDVDAHQISVTAIPERLDEIDVLIKAWDVKLKQVQIEAFLVSASTDVARDLGVSWSYFDNKNGNPFAIRSGTSAPDYTTPPTQGQSMTFGTLPYQVPMTDIWTGKAITSLKDVAGNTVLAPEFKGSRISAVLNLLDKQGQVTVLAQPRVTVRDGQEASFENIEDEPYQQGGYYGNAGTPTNTVNPLVQNYNPVIPLNVSFIKVGTILTVSPRINEESNVLLDISAENSTAKTVTVKTASLESTIPQKLQNKAETQVLVHDGQTVVIGGLRAGKVENGVERVPLLGDLPLVGRLFKSTNKARNQQDLLIFITPTIVDEFTQPESEQLAATEESMTKEMRHSQKSLAGRTADRASQGKNEIVVSIGADGTMRSNGNVVTLEEIKTTFADGDHAGATVVIRRHPRAPKGITNDVEAAANESGLKVQHDKSIAPVVPAARPK